MKRRKVLTSAGVMAGAALTGCGGGEEGALGGDPSSQIGAYTVPRNLVPNIGTYQVEVVYMKPRRQVRVWLGHSTGLVLIGSTFYAYASNAGNSHRVDFAMFRCTAEANRNNSFFWVQVDDGTQRYVHGGKAGIVASDWVQYLTHNDGEPEFEWKFYSITEKEHFVSVRFFPVPTSETTFASGQYIQVIRNNCSSPTVADQTRRLPKHYETPYQITNHESAALWHPDNLDTICLPNNRQVGHDELVPSYLAASPEMKPLLKRRLLRHIDRFARNARAIHPMDTADDQEVHHLLGNELLRTLGGDSLISHLNYVRDNVRTSIQNNMDQMGAEFDQFCTTNLPALSSQSMIDSTRNLLEVAENGEANSRAAGGCGVSTTLEAGFSMTSAAFWPGIDLGGGVKVVIGLARASKKWAQGVISAADTYSVNEINTKGSKLGFTFIIKGFAGSSCLIGNISADIEVTLNCTVIDRNWRLDSLVFNPIIDVDTRTWLGKLIAKGYERLLAPVVGGRQAVAAIPQVMAYGVPGYMTGLGPELGVFAGRLASTAVGLVNAGVKHVMNPMLQTVRDKLDAQGADTRTWGVLQLSVLRIMIVNSDVENPAIPFRGGFRYGGTGWQPGLKYSAGFGIAPTYSVPYFPPGTPRPPGTITYSGFLKVVSNADVYALFGTPEFIRASSFPWDM